MRELGAEAVVLDAGGVLLLPDPELIRSALAPFGIQPDDATCRQGTYESSRQLDLHDEWDWPEVDRRLATWFGVGEAEAEAAGEAIGRAFQFEDWVPVPGAAEALRALQGCGLRLAIVSNASGSVERQLASHRICSVRGGDAAEVAVVVDSHVVGVEKPDPAIFTFAIDALGVAPARCLYVGDTVRFDVNGARAAGLHPVHLDPYDLCDGGDHHHVPSLEALVAQLGC